MYKPNFSNSIHQYLAANQGVETKGQNHHTHAKKKNSRDTIATQSTIDLQIKLMGPTFKKKHPLTTQ